MPTRNFLIKAGTGKQIAVVMKGMSIMFNTNISNNLPTNFFMSGMLGRSKTTDTTEFVKDLDRSYFMPVPGEIVVDNEDENFKLISPSSRKRLKNLISPLQESKYELGTNLTIREGVEVVPKHMINFQAYGLNKLTHAFMLQGSKATMEWRRPGLNVKEEYEILAYIPPKVFAHRIEEQERGGRGSGFFFYFSFFCDRNGAGRDKTVLRREYWRGEAGGFRRCKGTGGMGFRWGFFSCLSENVKSC